MTCLKKKARKTPRGSDFGGGDETVISSKFDRPVIIHRYPSNIKAFYMQPDAEKPELALCMDMLAPEGYGEIIGGSQRIHDLDLIMDRIREHNLPPEAFNWFLDLRKYGNRSPQRFWNGHRKGGSLDLQA